MHLIKRTVDFALAAIATLTYGAARKRQRDTQRDGKQFKRSIAAKLKKPVVRKQDHDYALVCAHRAARWLKYHDLTICKPPRHIAEKMEVARQMGLKIEAARGHT